MSKVRQQLDSIVSFLNPLMPMANCHMVEFFTQNHWDTLIPENLRVVLERCQLSETLDKFWEYSTSNTGHGKRQFI
jgi:hypothetical protein